MGQSRVYCKLHKNLHGGGDYSSTFDIWVECEGQFSAMVKGVKKLLAIGLLSQDE